MGSFLAERAQTRLWVALFAEGAPKEKQQRHFFSMPNGVSQEWN